MLHRYSRLYFNLLYEGFSANIFVCVCLPISCKICHCPCSDRTNLLANILGATTCFQTVVNSSTDWPLFFSLVAELMQRFQDSNAWLGALLTPQDICLSSWTNLLQGPCQIIDVLLEKKKKRIKCWNFKAGCFKATILSYGQCIYWTSGYENYPNHFVNRMRFVTVKMNCKPKFLFMAFYNSCFIIVIISGLYNLYILVWVMLAVRFCHRTHMRSLINEYGVYMIQFVSCLSVVNLPCFSIWTSSSIFFLTISISCIPHWVSLT